MSRNVSSGKRVGPRCRDGRAFGRRLLFAALVATFALALSPDAALAREYEITGVNGDLTVNTDGSISVVEERTFDFDGSFNGVYWDLSTEGPATRSSYDNEVAIEDISVEDLTSGLSFTEGDSGETGTYELSEGYDYLRVKIYTPHSDESATVRISYKVTNIVNRWADTGELYYKFVSDGWDVESQNVTYRVHLPVPSGESVTPEDNVRAWGHGPLDASLAFDGNDVVYTAPGVGSSEYAEARVTFPQEWLSDMDVSSMSYLDVILYNEQRWADAANERRERARRIMAAATGVGFGGPAVILALSAVLKRRYSRMKAPNFSDEYFRDVPSDDHPAVLGALWSHNKVTSECFTATLMKLTDDGVIGLNLVSDDKGRPKDYQITRGNLDAQCDIDDAAMALMFNVVAPRGKDRKRSTAPAGGYTDLRVSDFKRAAKKAPATYAEAMQDWEKEILDVVKERGFFKGGGPTGRAPLIVLSSILGLASFIAGFVMQVEGSFWVGAIAIVLAIVAFAVGLVVGLTLKPMSAEGVELYAKLSALRRWLNEFTLLDEAVPRDVALWDRLLVMAVVLGVADRVIAQLKVAAPEILEDPYFYSYWWYHDYGRIDSPASFVTHGYETAHNVTTAALASSSSSSGGGGGGAF